uniref:ARAD1D35992p n=1 Tax=Blastobotrys adeninivorans TaxID=409370 RepID=A0A060TI40_BLAAD
MLRTSVRAIRPVRATGVRLASTRAISNPTLMNIEGRWETMSEEERNDIITQLAERQKGPWSELTVAEKRAAWYISYGPWGPRKPIHAPGSGKKIVAGILGVVAAAGLLFGAFRLTFSTPPVSMSKEWQELSNEALKEKNANPFTGYDQVQSPSRGLPEQEDEE